MAALLKHLNTISRFSKFIFTILFQKKKPHMWGGTARYMIGMPGAPSLIIFSLIYKVHRLSLGSCVVPSLFFSMCLNTEETYFIHIGGIMRLEVIFLSLCFLILTIVFRLGPKFKLLYNSNFLKSMQNLCMKLLLCEVALLKFSWLSNNKSLILMNNCIFW